MVADYADPAVLVRGDDVYRGREEIRDYFDTVPSRLGGRSVEFEEPEERSPGVVEVRWRIAGTPISGLDRYHLRDGRIVEQIVLLDAGDF
jgi:hypothetical protein